MPSPRALGLLAAAVCLIVVTSLAWTARANDVVKDPTAAPPKASGGGPAGPLDFTMKDIDGKDKPLADYKGKVVLLVNVASKCGNTPQYEGLEKMYEKYKGRGLVVVGLPANDFKSQEPGTEQQIKEFCTSKYGVTFPMMAKISVKGDDKAPLYKFLTKAPTAGDFAGDVEWNFGKFLVDRNGNVIARFNPKTKPEDPKVVAAVEKALGAKAAEGK